MYSVSSACRGLSMHEAESLSGEIRLSVPCIILQTKTEEGKGQRVVMWASCMGMLDPAA